MLEAMGKRRSDVTIIVSMAAAWLAVNLFIVFDFNKPNLQLSVILLTRKCVLLPFQHEISFF